MCQPKKEKKFYPLNILIIKMTTIEIFNLEKKKKEEIMQKSIKRFHIDK